MTVSTSTNRIEYTGDAVTTAFSFPYYFLANGDLKVYLDGVLQTITTHYTVTGAANPAGGTVTFVTAPPSGDLVVIYREVALTQSVDYSPNDPFPANTHEQALDRLTMIAQQLDEEIGRALKLPSTSTYSDLTVPDPQAGYYLQWKADLSGLQNVVEVSPTSITVSAFGATLVDDADAAVALATLGLTATASEINSAMDGILVTAHEINQGVEYANQYMAHENSPVGMTVLIDAGRMMYNGTLVSNAQQTVTINAAHATLPRIDRITISESTGVYTYTAGTAAASPSAPAIPAGQLPICQVSVPALDTTIANSQITDERALNVGSNNYTGNINGVSSRAIVILDTPESLVLNSAITGSWQTINNSTLATALAKAAIVRYRVIPTAASGTAVSGSGYLRKTGSGLVHDSTTMAVSAKGYLNSAGSFSAIGLAEAVVNLDASYDFDWRTELDSGSSSGTTITLVGYYV